MIKISQNTLDGINKAAVYLLFFVTPLAFVFSTRELFEFPKMILVYFFAAAMAGLYIMQRNSKNFGHSPLLKPLLVLTIIVAISTIFSMNRYTSIFGYYSRFNGGLLSVLAFLTIFHFCSSFINKRGAGSAVTAIFFSGVIVSLYALLQNLGFDKDFWVQDSQARAFSTLGQPNWLAAYLLVIIPIPLYKYLNETEMFKKGAYFCAALLFYFAFWSTYSLSGFLGLLAFSLLFLLGSFQTVALKWKELLLLGFICLAVSVARPGIFGAKIKSFVETLKPVISITKEALAAAVPPKAEPQAAKSIDTGDIRLGVWQGALKLWVDSPKNFLIGTGPETFAYAFLHFRPLSLNKSTEWDFLYNKAHNYYLDLLTGTGLLGLLAYLLFSAAVIINTLKAKTQGPGSLQRILLYGWATIFVTNFFGWPTVTLSLLFFLYPVLINRLNSSESSDLIENKVIGISAVKIIAALVLFMPLAFGTLNIFLADVSFSQGYGSSQNGDVEKADPALKDAVSLNPWEPAYHKELAYTYAQKYVEGENEKDLNMAIKEARTAYDLNPHNSLTLRSLIRVYYLLSKVKPQYKTDLEKMALEIISLSPTEPRSYYDAALMFYYSGDKGPARELNSEAIKLRPGYPEALELAPKLAATPSAEKK